MDDARHLTLELSAQPDALPRVLALCRRRGARIVALTYAHADRHRPARLELALRVDDRRGGPLLAGLAALLDVHALREG